MESGTLWPATVQMADNPLKERVHLATGQRESRHPKPGKCPITHWTMARLKFRPPGSSTLAVLKAPDLAVQAYGTANPL